MLSQKTASRAEHKVEHNNCRMKAPESDLEASSPTVSPRVVLLVSKSFSFEMQHYVET
jgi:hypothetical protein